MLRFPAMRRTLQHLFGAAGATVPLMVSGGIVSSPFAVAAYVTLDLISHTSWQVYSVQRQQGGN
jgi:hypothetical protein